MSDQGAIWEWVNHWHRPKQVRVAEREGIRVLEALPAREDGWMHAEDRDWYDLIGRAYKEGGSPVAALANVLRVAVKGREVPPELAFSLWRGSKRAGARLDPRTVARVRRAVEQNARAFVEEWGFLGLRELEPWKSRWPRHLPRGDGLEPVEFFLEASLRFALLAETAARFPDAPPKERPKLASKLTHGFGAWEVGVDGRWKVEGLLQALKGVSVFVGWDQGASRFVLGWQYGTLWHAMHLMLGLTLVERRGELRRCRRGRCGRLFLAVSPRRLYCSEQCKRAEGMARLRAGRLPGGGGDA